MADHPALALFLEIWGGLAALAVIGIWLLGRAADRLGAVGDDMPESPKACRVDQRAAYCCDGTCGQGRACPQVVPSISIAAGRPAPRRAASADRRPGR